jgi:hypothetical protein
MNRDQATGRALKRVRSIVRAAVFNELPYTLGSRSHRLYPRVEGHEAEVGKVEACKDACQQYIRALRRLQSEITESDEGDCKHGQEGA